MANQVALHVLTRPGDEVLAARGLPHPALRVGRRRRRSPGSRSRCSGGGGRFTADGGARRAHAPPIRTSRRSRLVAIENTHNDAGGRVFPLRGAGTIAAARARARSCALHLDGARLCNAAVASGIPAAAWAAPFDTVSVCLSKGLGAPVGSVVRGSSRAAPRGAAPRAQDARRRHAPGGRARRRRALRARAPRGAAAPRTTPTRARLAAGLEALGLRVEGEARDQHRDVPRAASRSHSGRPPARRAFASTRRAAPGCAP